MSIVSHVSKSTSQHSGPPSPGLDHQTSPHGASLRPTFVRSLTHPPAHHPPNGLGMGAAGDTKINTAPALEGAQIGDEGQGRIAQPRVWEAALQGLK